MITNSPVATFESYYKNITTTVDKFGASDLQKQFQVNHFLSLFANSTHKNMHKQSMNVHKSL